MEWFQGSGTSLGNLGEGLITFSVNLHWPLKTQALMASECILSPFHSGKRRNSKRSPKHQEQNPREGNETKSKPVCDKLCHLSFAIQDKHPALDLQPPYVPFSFQTGAQDVALGSKTCQDLYGIYIFIYCVPSAGGLLLQENRRTLQRPGGTWVFPSDREK